MFAVAYEITAYQKGAIKVYDVDSWKLKYVLADTPSVWWLTFSQDGRRLTGAGGFDTYVWDLPTYDPAGD